MNLHERIMAVIVAFTLSMCLLTACGGGGSSSTSSSSSSDASSSIPSSSNSSSDPDSSSDDSSSSEAPVTPMGDGTLTLFSITAKATQDKIDPLKFYIEIKNNREKEGVQFPPKSFGIVITDGTSKIETEYDVTVDYVETPYRAYPCNWMSETLNSGESITVTVTAVGGYCKSGDTITLIYVPYYSSSFPYGGSANWVYNVK